MKLIKSFLDLTGRISRPMATQHPTQPRVAVDLFEKARNHERVEQLKAAREQDLLPYFRLLEGPAGPASGADPQPVTPPPPVAASQAARQ